MLPLLLALLLGAPPSPAAPLRLTSKAFDQPVEIEVRDLPRETSREIIQKALAEVAEIERLTGATGSGIPALNAAAGKGPQPVDPRLFAALTRARDFCVWSEGAHGPLGLNLYRLWAESSEPPPPERVEQAVGLAACDRLTLDPQKGTAALAAGSGLDLRGFAEGHAVDRAVEILRKEGAANAFVRIGAVQRAIGAGPGGKGWTAELFQAPGQAEPPDRVYLRDRALAIASQTLYVNQRTGRPAQGVLATAAVTDLAVDAQGLASALLITGPREGQLRLGSLRPKPSARWFLGGGAGTPLLVDYRWSEVARR
ncbi:MAG TPA: FAD:protein FMN transferase [Thermoanaerobaculia bacterium]|jgi:thiamine biosynthesis lipoprotein|nr:FAD:protein FMN transferase [Thermoanaerobaculia bacterium]